MDDLGTDLYQFAKDSHQEFAEVVWVNNPQAARFQFQNKTITPSYHNHHHIIGVVQASRQFVSALFDQNQDPLCIARDLEKWNTQKKTALSLSDFQTILEIAFATHDLGNLTKNPHLILQDGKPKIEYSTQFELQVGPSEKRSDILAIELIEYFDHQNIFTSEMKNLVGHLILQTVFHPAETTSETPFWLLIQFIDQVGSYYFSRTSLDHASAGYLNELYVSANIKERTPFSLKQYLSFLPNRFYQLIPNKSEQQKLIKILDPNQSQQYILKGFANVPDRPINHQEDIEAIYRGEFNF